MRSRGNARKPPLWTPNARLGLGQRWRTDQAVLSRCGTLKADNQAAVLPLVGRRSAGSPARHATRASFTPDACDAVVSFESQRPRGRAALPGCRVVLSRTRCGGGL